MQSEYPQTHVLGNRTKTIPQMRKRLIEIANEHKLPELREIAEGLYRKSALKKGNELRSGARDHGVPEAGLLPFNPGHHRTDDEPRQQDQAGRSAADYRIRQPMTAARKAW